MTMPEAVLIVIITALLTVGVVQLIDYERERKWRDKARRHALKRWFDQKMYNFESYGNIEGAPKSVYSTFEQDCPEYKSEYSSDPYKEG